MFYTYIIKNDISGKIYTGQTSDLKNRLNRHNGLLKNKLKSFTSKNRGVWRLVYNETYNTRQEAIRREKWLKSGIGREYIKKVVS